MNIPTNCVNRPYSRALHDFTFFFLQQYYITLTTFNSLHLPMKHVIEFSFTKDIRMLITKYRLRYIIDFAVKNPSIFQ